MNKELMKPLLTIGLVLCLVCTVMASAESVMNRAERILQTSGTANNRVEFKVGAEINQQCDSQGLSTKDLDITEAQRKGLRAEILGRFSGVFNSFVDAKSFGKELVYTSSAISGQLNTDSNTLFAAIIFFLDLPFFFFMIFWSFTECCWQTNLLSWATAKRWTWRQA